ncbi:hypothetical protein GCM10027425_09310 [Alteromonas gracilis]
MSRVNLGRDSSGRALIVDQTTLDKLDAAELRLGITLTITQGSYINSTAASAGTHAKSGVIDLRTWDLPDRVTREQLVRTLRLCGLIAWLRTKAQGFDEEHVHAIDYGNPGLAPAAAAQVRAWQAGLNGLASAGPDDGPRVQVPKKAPPPPKVDNNVTRMRDHQQHALRHIRHAQQYAVAASKAGRGAVRVIAIPANSTAAAALRLSLKRTPPR